MDEQNKKVVVSKHGNPDKAKIAKRRAKEKNRRKANKQRRK